ncbi:hypothetical protein HFC70_13250 [Agrobacterium sp. a22-2]|uniref:DUF6644 family protein n=1 Tax=Agrobacterium sp. a22-2 TaxID=2283840 RepID=UPI001448310F|nr:DUF6644 family protein [Agrobacterium sp. a22-2]NKN37322.1 hypothetical protein [Agrobacterium sp. a22-2]
MQLTEAFEWIETIPLVRMIVTIPGLYPAISALHILGIALLVGSIAIVDLRLLGVLSAKLDEALSDLMRMALVGFAVAASTGLLLVSVQIDHYASNPAFLTKMAILLVAGTNAVLLRAAAGAADIRRVLDTSRGRIAAALSLAVWVSAIFSGRWIAFI